MKELVTKSSLNLIKKQCPEYSEVKLAEIEYGLVSLYLTISKTIVIGAIALLLGLFKELVIFAVIYNIIRMPSFGLHATKSWICLVSSTIVFIGVPYICTIVSISIWVKLLIGIIGILLMFKNSPADTHKRPIINPKRRKTYKLISTGLAITFVIASIYIPDSFLSNSFIFALTSQCFIISPAVYSLFGLPYDNYKNYMPTAQLKV